MDKAAAAKTTSWSRAGLVGLYGIGMTVMAIILALALLHFVSPLRAFFRFEQLDAPALGAMGVVAILIPSMTRRIEARLGWRRPFGFGGRDVS